MKLSKAYEKAVCTKLSEDMQFDAATSRLSDSDQGKGFKQGSLDIKRKTLEIHT